MPCCPPDSVGQRCRVNAKNFFAELKRRHVYKVAAAYAIVAWLLIQIATQVFPFFEIPNWGVRLIVLGIVIGFPVALILAWAFELTPEGIKRAEDVAPDESIKRRTGHKLDFLIIAVLLLVIGALVYQQLRPKRSATATSTSVAIPEKSIAVLPFENLSANQENAFFTDGVQDEILADLAKVADLKVISRASVMLYKSGNPRNLREIGQQLGVAHVLEGSVQRAANRIRVTAQLIDARSDAHLWAQTYDRDLADVFAIQSEIAKTIADQLQAKLSPNERAAIEERPTGDLAAFDLYNRARALQLSASFGGRAKENFLQAVELLNQTVARDPKFFIAYCRLAEVHDRLYFINADHTPARLASAEAAVQAALRLRPDDGEAHLALANYYYYGFRDYDRARAEIAIAQRALPNSSQVFALMGYIDRRQGRWDESARNLEKALELDPRNFYTLQQVAVNYNSLRRYADMVAVLDRALSLVPKDVDTRVARALIDLDWRADPRPLHATIDAIVAEDPATASSFADSWMTLALCERDAAAAGRALAALAGNESGEDAVRFSRAFSEGLLARARGDNAAARSAFTAARAQQENVVRAQPDNAPPLCVLGLIDAGLGRKEDALREGRRAVELLPVTRDSLNGAHMIEFFAIICAWTGEKDLALQQLAIATQIPGSLSYGRLRLHPYWDSLRGDPRFEKIVASLAPKA
jgi:TolB-like protein/Tfp pilus assembly protein PilF